MFIQASSLAKHYGDQKAVDSVSFTVDSGEVVGFVGANGAGKTTTISLILGFIRPTSGSVRVFGDEVTPGTTHLSHRSMGYASGDMALPARMTGEQYLAFVRSQYGSTDEERFRELCERFQPQLHKKLGELSRGNHQKIALIAAFVSAPKLVILDEPTSGLDPIMQAAFLELVKQEQSRGVTVFMSSHYLNEVADACDRILLMREGMLVRDVQANELLKQSGKSVRVTVAHAMVKPPIGAEHVARTKQPEGRVEFSFHWNGTMQVLQSWVAGLKSLEDIEITEYDLANAFKDMYKSEDV